uniref:Glycoprotein hormone subunit beta 5 n=1 Tax=Neogobius melanostomus TaxID=47308 RepID=A0A8C6U2T1_9GOBI
MHNIILIVEVEVLCSHVSIVGIEKLLLLFLLLIALSSSALNLRRFTGCAVREFTFMAKKPGCGGLHVTTDACWGRCETWEVRPVGTRQDSVSIIVFVLLSVGRGPHLHLPLRLRCECGLCLTRTTECETVRPGLTSHHGKKN